MLERDPGRDRRLRVRQCVQRSSVGAQRFELRATLLAYVEVARFSGIGRVIERDGQVFQVSGETYFFPLHRLARDGPKQLAHTCARLE